MAAQDTQTTWQLLCADASGPRAQAQGVPVAAQQDPHPVELHLDSPAATDGQLHSPRQHRGSETRQLLSRRHTARVSETASRDANPARGRSRFLGLNLGVAHTDAYLGGGPPGC